MNAAPTTARRHATTAQQDARIERHGKLFAWSGVLVLLYNLPVILWGAYVRVSFSGDGCGANWPFCNGQIIPQKMSVPTSIEYAHRMMTTVDSVLVFGLCAAAFWLYPRRHVVRKAAAWSCFFLLVEALLGAGLVLFRFVAHDQSAGRIWYLSAHLINTMLLLAALAATSWFAGSRTSSFRIRYLSGQSVLALCIVVVVSITGTIAALGDMLFPASSLSSGLTQDFASTSAVLLRLRFLHPALAVAAAFFLFFLSIRVRNSSADQAVRRSATGVATVTIVQLMVGAVNLSLLAPISLQLLHLLIADILWLAVWVMSLETSSNNRQLQERRPLAA
jgi:heme a synthase